MAASALPASAVSAPSTSASAISASSAASSTSVTSDINSSSSFQIQLPKSYLLNSPIDKDGHTIMDYLVFPDLTKKLIAELEAKKIAQAAVPTTDSAAPTIEVSLTSASSSSPSTIASPLLEPATSASAPITTNNSPNKTAENKEEEREAEVKDSYFSISDKNQYFSLLAQLIPLGGRIDIGEKGERICDHLETNLEMIKKLSETTSLSEDLVGVTSEYASEVNFGRNESDLKVIEREMERIKKEDANKERRLKEIEERRISKTLGKEGKKEKDNKEGNNNQRSGEEEAGSSAAASPPTSTGVTAAAPVNSNSSKKVFLLP